MIHEETFINPYTLNIFCDASMKGKEGCYGAIAYCEYTPVDSMYRIDSSTTSNNAEIKAIRSGVDIALKLRNHYRRINIFSDSQISIFGIRDRIFNWRQTHESTDLYGLDNNLIKSQNIYVEIMKTIVNNDLYINFYHQKGHVNVALFGSIAHAEHVFKASNGIRDNVDFNFIKYISILNNRVDRCSRNILTNRKDHNVKTDALIFRADGSFEMEKEKYGELISNDI